MKRNSIMIMAVLVFGLLLLAKPVRASAAGGPTFPSEWQITVTEGTEAANLGEITFPNVASAGFTTISVSTPYTDLVSASGARIPTTLVLYMKSRTDAMKQTGNNVSGNGRPVVYDYSKNQFPLHAELCVSAADWAAAEHGTYTGEVRYEFFCRDSAGNQTVFNYYQVITVQVIRVPIDAAHFPDSVFRGIVSSDYDLNGDGILTGSETKNVTYMDVSRKGLTSLKGIEYFPMLEYLYADRNQLTSLDLSANKALKTLQCDYNQLTSLDLSSNSKLTYVSCAINRLTSLNVGSCYLLEHLNFSQNSVDHFYFGGANLQTLQCDYNNLYMITLRNAPQLHYFECEVNPLPLIFLGNTPLIADVYQHGLRSESGTGDSGYYTYYHKDNDPNSSFYIDKSVRVYPTRFQGWEKVGRYWYYFHYDAGPIVGQFITIEDVPYYFDVYGIMANNGWKYIDNKWHYINVSGVIATGWKQIDGKWYYFEDVFGDMVASRFLTLNGKTYYMTAPGAMATGWKKIDGTWYYFDPTSGVMAKNAWKEIDGKWYWFDSAGQMATGWQTIGGKTYYFTSGGEMVTGWKTIGGNRYYFFESGVMAVGWKTIGGKTYYFKNGGTDNGVMAANEYCVGWWLNADGTWTYPYQAHWEEDMHGWYYIDTSGWYAKNATYVIDGVSYTFNAQGYRVP